MSSVLSEISNTLQTSTIKDAVVNMYHDTINKLSKVKDVFVKKEDPEILPKIVKDTMPLKDAVPLKDEGYVSPTKPKTPKEIVVATLTKVKDVVWEYGLKFIVIAFYIGLASLVANDMIIYAAPIRAFFFLFTLFFTVTLFPCAFFVAFYYLLRRGYDYYNKNLSSAKDKPPQTFPTIFAILPLTTYYPTSPFIRFFLWIFMYQKSDKPERMERENERLEIIMKNYWNDLNGSFEYIDKIKDTPPFKDLYGMIEKKLTIEGMHPIQKPDKVIEPSKTLPEVIEKKEEGEGEGEKGEKGEKVQFFKPEGTNQAKKKEEKEVINNTATKATNNTAANTVAPEANAAANTVAPAANAAVPVANTAAPVTNTVAPAANTVAPAANTVVPAANTVAPVVKAPLPPTI